MTHGAHSAASQRPQGPEDHPSSESVFTAVSLVNQQLATIEKFIARRFDEISMEINATAQQVDMAEEGITKRFMEILEVLHAISYSGDGTTPANTGVELDAVVEMTEQAANRILDAADRISSKLRREDGWKSDEERNAILSEISDDVEEIFMACSFQDITGQRIRKTLENLKTIEDRLGTALQKMGIEIPQEPPQVVKATTQDDIDKLFS